MAWSGLKASIDAIVKANGNQEINGTNMNQVLDSIIDNIGENAGFIDIAIPTTVPSAIDGTGFYLASEDGAYPNFGGAIVDNEVCVFEYVSSAWVKKTIINNNGNVKDIEINSYLRKKTKNGDKIDVLYQKNIGSYVNSVGGLTPNASSEYSDYIPVIPLSDYRYIGKMIGNVLYIAFYDINLGYISGASDSGTLIDFPFTTPADAYYIRYSTFDYLTTKSYVLYEGVIEYSNRRVDELNYNTSYPMHSEALNPVGVIFKKIEVEILNNTYSLRKLDGKLKKFRVYLIGTAGTDYRLFWRNDDELDAPEYLGGVIPISGADPANLIFTHSNANIKITAVLDMNGYTGSYSDDLFSDYGIDDSILAKAEDEGVHVVTEVISTTMFEISPTIEDLGVTPPIYNSIQGALNAILDNDYNNRYVLELLDGVHDADSILLKDYVDIVRSDKATSEVIIEHDYSGEPVNERDLFKTNSNPYVAATEDFPLHVKFKDLTMQGANINYCIHSDFNESSDFEITAERCKFRNDDVTTTSSAADYGVGIGIYGGQKIQFDDCQFFGRVIPVVEQPKYRQGSGWVVHNRNAQTKNCNVAFNNCNSTGFYGGRVVEFGSGMDDTININGGLLNGIKGSLLLFNDTGITTQSLTVNCTAQLQRLQPSQEIDTGVRLNSKIKVVSSVTDVYKTTEIIEIGDVLIYADEFGVAVKKSVASETNNYIVGIAQSDALSGEFVTVRKSGLCAVKFDSAIGANIEMTISDSIGGSLKAAASGDKVIAVTSLASSDTVNDEFNPGLVMVVLM